jgi:hypothetical protein
MKNRKKISKIPKRWIVCQHTYVTTHTPESASTEHFVLYVCWRHGYWSFTPERLLAFVFHVHSEALRARKVSNGGFLVEVNS